MSIKNMDFDMKVGERLKVLDGFVIIEQVDGGIRYYSLKGKLLSRFSKEQMEKRSQPTLICMRDCILTPKDNYWYVLTYIGVEICKFEATNVEIYKNYIVIKNDKEMRVYDTEKRKFIGETFDEIWRWGECFVLKKDGVHYLYNVENKAIEEKFKICSMAQYTRGKTFILLYYKNKCGLWVLERHDSSFSMVLPIEYQKIQIAGDEIFAMKNGEKEYYPLKVNYCKKKRYNADYDSRNIKMKSDYKINFLNSIQVLFREEITVNEKFILVSGNFKEKRPYKYYTLQGKYIGSSGMITDEFDEYCGENYVATENMLALGGNQSIPFGPTNEEWKIYDYEGKMLIEENLKFQKIGIGGYFLGTSSGEEDISYIFSDKGKILFTFNNLNEVFDINDKYCEILDNDNNIWILDNNGKAIFNNGIKYDNFVYLYYGFAGEKVKEGYNIYNFIQGKVYYILADSIEVMNTYSCMPEILIKVTCKEKQGVIILNAKGCEFLAPVEYLEVKKHDEFILAKAEEWDDIFSLDGTLIMSTK